MKLERVNDHQIRCTLTKADLADRQIKLSELAYGTDKAKTLFRDMMQQASYELGFEANNIPLMIEAIPLSSESIILIITKVEDPDELDTRFANFAPNIRDEDDAVSEIMKSVSEEMPGVLDLFKKITQEVSKNPELLEEAKERIMEEAASANELSRAFVFESLSDVIRAAKVIKRVYRGRNSLYKDDADGNYILAISKSELTMEEFNKVCNCLSEYGQMKKSSLASEAFMLEHHNCIIEDNAIDTLLS